MVKVIVHVTAHAGSEAELQRVPVGLRRVARSVAVPRSSASRAGSGSNPPNPTCGRKRELMARVIATSRSAAAGKFGQEDPDLGARVLERDALSPEHRSDGLPGCV